MWMFSFAFISFELWTSCIRINTFCMLYYCCNVCHERGSWHWSTGKTKNFFRTRNKIKFWKRIKCGCKWEMDSLQRIYNNQTKPNMIYWHLAFYGAHVCNVWMWDMNYTISLENAARRTRTPNALIVLLRQLADRINGILLNKWLWVDGPNISGATNDVCSTVLPPNHHHHIRHTRQYMCCDRWNVRQASAVRAPWIVCAICISELARGFGILSIVDAHVVYW